MKAKKKKMKPMTQMNKYTQVIIKYNHYYLATRKLTNI